VVVKDAENAALLAAGALRFLGVRAFFVPHSFGQYGHYRGDAIAIAEIAALPSVQVYKLGDTVRRRMYTLAGLLILVSILAMRWNVAIGDQLFSKSFLGYSTYEMGFATREGLLTAVALLILLFLILWGLLKLFPPWAEQKVL